MQVLEHAAHVQLFQLMVQDSYDTDEYQEGGERREPAEAAAILALGKCRGYRLGSQDFSASGACT